VLGAEEVELLPWFVMISLWEQKGIITKQMKQESSSSTGSIEQHRLSSSPDTSSDDRRQCPCSIKKPSSMASAYRLLVSGDSKDPVHNHRDSHSALLSGLSSL